jgi:hypothetical protein
VQASRWADCGLNESAALLLLGRAWQARGTHILGSDLWLPVTRSPNLEAERRRASVPPGPSLPGALLASGAEFRFEASRMKEHELEGTCKGQDVRGHVCFPESQCNLGVPVAALRAELRGRVREGTGIREPAVPRGIQCYCPGKRSCFGGQAHRYIWGRTGGGSVHSRSRTNGLAPWRRLTGCE